MSVRRWSGLVVALALALGGLTACGSKSAADLGDPAKVLKTAEQKLEDTSGVTLTLTTDDLPDGFIRFSAGIEDTVDLVADLRDALDAVDVAR
jgi:hypothetical protein